MIIVDANLLIYATNSDLPEHSTARSFIDMQLSGAVHLGLPWLVVVAFVRLTTNRRVFERPLSVQESLAIVNGWLQLSSVEMINPGPSHWQTLSRLLMRSGTAGNLTNDAHLAAIAIDHGALICSADNDFKRFEGVQHYNPIHDHEGIKEPLLVYR